MLKYNPEEFNFMNAYNSKLGNGNFTKTFDTVVIYIFAASIDFSLKLFPKNIFQCHNRGLL